MIFSIIFFLHFFESYVDVARVPFKNDFVPKCNNGKTICEEVDIYPENKFYNVLQNSSYEDEYFKSQLAQEDPSNRFHADEDHYICDSITKLQYPKVARNIKNKWKFIYNFDKYKQAITTEECVNGNSCASLKGSPAVIRTKCVQKYSDVLLLVADKDSNPVWDVFLIPSACVCTYEPIIKFKFF